MNVFLILALVFALLGAISVPAGKISWLSLAFAMFVCSLLFGGYVDAGVHHPLLGR